MDYKLTQAQYARIYGVTERSIRTYQGQEVPLDEPGKAAATLSLRKAPAPGLRTPDAAKAAYRLETGEAAVSARDFAVANVGDALYDLDEARREVGELVEKHRLPSWEKIHDLLNEMVAPIDAAYRLAGCPELMDRARALLPDAAATVPE